MSRKTLVAMIVALVLALGGILAWNLIASHPGSFYAGGKEALLFKSIFKISLIVIGALVALFVISSRVIGQVGKLKELDTIFSNKIMGPHPDMLETGDTLEKAKVTLLKSPVNILPVVNEYLELQGFFSKEMLKRILGQKDDTGDPLEDKGSDAPVQEAKKGPTIKNFMSKDLVFVYTYDSVRKALDVMVKSRYKGIPVIDDQKHVVGFITRADLEKVITKDYLDSIFLKKV